MLNSKAVALLNMAQQRGLVEFSIEQEDISTFVWRDNRNDADILEEGRLTDDQMVTLKTMYTERESVDHWNLLIEMPGRKDGRYVMNWYQVRVDGDGDVDAVVAKAGEWAVPDGAVLVKAKTSVVPFYGHAKPTVKVEEVGTGQHWQSEWFRKVFYKEYPFKWASEEHVGLLIQWVLTEKALAEISKG